MACSCGIAAVICAKPREVISPIELRHQQRNKKPKTIFLRSPHETTTVLNIPASMWYIRWQWKAHRPGVSALTR